MCIATFLSNLFGANSKRETAIIYVHQYMRSVYYHIFVYRIMLCAFMDLYTSLGLDPCSGTWSGEPCPMGWAALLHVVLARLRGVWSGRLAGPAAEIAENMKLLP